MVYFVLDEDRRLIEIGVTAHMNTRLDQLRRGSAGPLRVLAVLDGGLVEAAAVRGRFAHLRSLGDWHRIDATLLGYIESEGHRWEGGSPIGTPPYRDRLADLAARSQIPAAALAERALSEWAARNGLSDDPVDESGPARLPTSAEPIAIAAFEPGPAGAPARGGPFRIPR